MALNEQTIPIEREPVEVTAGAVDSVNGKTGDVWLTAEDVEALPEDTFIPEKTSQLENDSNFATSDDVAQAVAGKQNALTEAQLDAVNSGIDSTKVAQIDTNTDNISAETTAREQADIGLQGQIDAISASSDVTDIVGTYADLQAYDTSKLKDNDIVKVLQDESQNDETTYYRWSTSTETFTLIGEEGPYYTKASADTKFQDKLTAGANISIDANNEISATDTTYSNFTGTDGVDAGTSGLVPAPATTDAGKYLKADGTWAEVEGGGGGGGPTEIQLTATTVIKDLITGGTIDKTGRYLLVNDTANSITLHANTSNETLDLARIDAGRQAILDVVLYENNNTYIGYYYAVLNYRDNNGGHTIHFNNSTFPSYSSITAVDSGTLAEYIQSDNYGQAPSAAAVYAHVASATANSPQAVYASSVHSVTSTGFSVDTGYDFQSLLPTLQSKEVYVMAYIGSYQAPVHGLPAGYYKFRVNGYSDNNDIYLTYVHSDGTIFGGVCPGNSQHFNFTVTKY